MSLRVLMVTPLSPLGQGGVERHVMEVSRRLAGLGVEVEVLCCAMPGTRAQVLEHEGVRIHSVRAYPATRDWGFAPAMWPEIARARADVMHLQSYHTLVAPLAMLRALRAKLPYVVTFHGGGHSSGLRNRARSAQRRGLAPLLRRADRLVAVAEFEIESYGRELGAAPERFVLIPNGTDIDVFAAPEPDPRVDDGAVIASIGRLERYKGHHRVIDALPHVLAIRPDARLLVVGRGPYESALRRRVAHLGLDDRVQFTSVPGADRAGMAQLLKQVSIVVLMSEFETHPLVALEAAAAYRRLLVADRGGQRELARQGIASAIALDASPSELGAAIAARLAEPAPTAAPQLTSWDECATRLLDLYRATVAR